MQIEMFRALRRRAGITLPEASPPIHPQQNSECARRLRGART